MAKGKRLKFFNTARWLSLLLIFTSWGWCAETNVSAAEDLMREHGVLNRLLLIYEEIAARLDNFQPFPLPCLVDTAHLVQNFVENYHEKLEEEYIFPPFEKAGKFNHLVKILRKQHQVGRKITRTILSLAREKKLKNDTRRLSLANYLRLYIRMYRPHEAREDTVLFPALKTVITQEEYQALGELFEKKGEEHFGKEGFEKIVHQVAEIEKQLHIFHLFQFTPELPQDKNEECQCLEGVIQLGG